MPTLLQINTALNYGSHGHITEGIGIMARAQGWRSVVAHGARYRNTSALESVQIGSSLDELVHGLFYSRMLDAHGTGSQAATRSFINDVRRNIRPDIIHLHNIHGYYLNYELLFRFLADYGAPVVWTLHDCWPFTGHCASFDYAGCGRWRSGCRDCPQRGMYPSSLFLDRSARNYASKKAAFTSIRNMTVVAVSRWLGSVAMQSFMGVYPVEVVHNGVDTALFTATPSGLREELGIGDRFVLLGVASPWSQRKGLDDFMALSRRLPSDCVIVLAGLTPEQRRDLPADMIGLPRTDSQRELAQLYSLADVTLSLSYEEAFGMTIAESMACGTPVIVYDRTALPELVTASTGATVPAGDIQGVADAVLRFRGRGKSACAAACRERALSCFDSCVQFGRYLDLYRRLL